MPRLGLWDLTGEGSSPLYYLHDALGSVRALVDAAAQPVLRYRFTPFGEPLGGHLTDGWQGLWAKGLPENPFGFTGEAHDRDLGLLYLRHRYLFPAQGRFMAPDPLPGFLSSPLSLHRYLYVENNPLNLVDPLGLRGIDAGELFRAGGAFVKTLDLVDQFGIAGVEVARAGGLRQALPRLQETATKVADTVLDYARIPSRPGTRPQDVASLVVKITKNVVSENVRKAASTHHASSAVSTLSLRTSAIAKSRLVSVPNAVLALGLVQGVSDMSRLYREGRLASLEGVGATLRTLGSALVIVGVVAGALSAAPVTVALLTAAGTAASLYGSALGMVAKDVALGADNRPRVPVPGFGR